MKLKLLLLMIGSGIQKRHGGIFQEWLVMMAKKNWFNHTMVQVILLLLTHSACKRESTSSPLMIYGEMVYVVRMVRAITISPQMMC